MLGQPKYQYGEKVQFQFDQKTVVGEVYIIDAYGTFFQNEEPSYDVMVPSIENRKCLHKHLRESSLKSVQNEEVSNTEG